MAANSTASIILHDSICWAARNTFPTARYALFRDRYIGLNLGRPNDRRVHPSAVISASSELRTDRKVRTQRVMHENILVKQ